MTLEMGIGLALAALVFGFVREWASNRGVWKRDDSDPYEMEIISYDPATGK